MVDVGFLVHGGARKYKYFNCPSFGRWPGHEDSGIIILRDATRRVFQPSVVKLFRGHDVQWLERPSVSRLCRPCRHHKLDCTCRCYQQSIDCETAAAQNARLRSRLVRVAHDLMASDPQFSKKLRAAPHLPVGQTRGPTARRPTSLDHGDSDHTKHTAHALLATRYW